jgi:hypothetical protein
MCSAANNIATVLRLQEADHRHDIIATERLAVAGAHVSAPGFGYVRRKGTGYAFEPA